MRRDEIGLLVSETSSWPGSIGDSCANTARSQVLNPVTTFTQFLQAFVTATGFVRHPSAPEGWRESDFSDDQMLPLYMAGSEAIKQKIRERSRFMSPTGGPHNPLTMCIINDWLISACFFLFIQKCLMMYLPYRWSDRDGLKWYQRFERTSESSADWLNWIAVAVYLKRRNRLFISVPVDYVSRKVFDYFSNEPNNTQVLADYEAAFVELAK